jgi:simple sugar transport system permease protein
MSRGQRIGYALAGPGIAIVIAFLISAVIIALAGINPFSTWGTVIDFTTSTNNMVEIVNRAIPLFLAGLAVAVGFRMNLFNIGVEGQYRLAACVAAAAGGAALLPGLLNTLLIIIVAMLVGAVWAGIAGVLRVTRNVNEVVATIMLNYIAFNLANWLLNNPFKYQVEGSSNVSTEPIPDSAWLEGFGIGGNDLWGFLWIAILLGIGYSVVVNRTRFGFDLRASGENAEAARASGVNAKRMILAAMLISGALAGTIGLPILLGTEPHAYDLSFSEGIGFNGIAVALLGRLAPVGMVFGALLFSFLDISKGAFQLEGLAPELVIVLQGTILYVAILADEFMREKQVKKAQEIAAARVESKPSDASEVKA